MPATFDHRAGALLRDTELQIGSTTAAVSVAGGLRYNGQAFQLLDASGQYDPRQVWVSPHAFLNDLMHAMGGGGPVLQGAYKVSSYASGGLFLLSETWFTSSAQATPISRHAFTYPTASYLNPVTESWTVYVSGTSTVAHTITDTMGYTGITEVSRVRTYT